MELCAGAANTLNVLKPSKRAEGVCAFAIDNTRSDRNIKKIARHFVPYSVGIHARSHLRFDEIQFNLFERKDVMPNGYRLINIHFRAMQRTRKKAPADVKNHNNLIRTLSIWPSNRIVHISDIGSRFDPDTPWPIFSRLIQHGIVSINIACVSTECIKSWTCHSAIGTGLQMEIGNFQFSESTKMTQFMREAAI